MGQGGDVCGSEAKRYIDVRMGHDGLGTFYRYIHTLPDLTLHVVDLSISLLPLSLSLSLPSSQLHISISLSLLSSRLILSQLTGTFGCFIHALVA